jgi:anthranilate phosphoribosyltransferase
MSAAAALQVVHCCGLDELAPIGVTHAIEVSADGGLREFIIDPATWATPVPQCSIDDLRGGSAADNAAVLRGVLGGGTARLAVAHTIALNAGAALYVWGSAASVEEGYAAALPAISDGRALALLDRWAAYTQKHAHNHAHAQAGGAAGEAPASATATGSASK